MQCKTGQGNISPAMSIDKPTALGPFFNAEALGSSMRLAMQANVTSTKERLKAAGIVQLFTPSSAILVVAVLVLVSLSSVAQTWQKARQ